MSKREELTTLIADSMALCRKVAAGLASGSGYAPEQEKEATP